MKTFQTVGKNWWGFMSWGEVVYYEEDEEGLCRVATETSLRINLHNQDLLLRNLFQINNQRFHPRERKSTKLWQYFFEFLTFSFFLLAPWTTDLSKKSFYPEPFKAFFFLKPERMEFQLPFTPAVFNPSVTQFVSNEGQNFFCPILNLWSSELYRIHFGRDKLVTSRIHK